MWEGSRLRRKLLLRRTAVILLIAVVTAWLGWAAIVGTIHATGSYTTTDGIVTAQTDTTARYPGCQLDVDYSVDANQLHGVVKVNADCSTLPKAGSPATLNVATADPRDIWIEGVNDANHPNPVVFGLLLLALPPVVAFALWNKLTDYGRVRKLIASGAQWRQVGATVASKDANRAGFSITLEAEDLSGKLCSFTVIYRYSSPIGPVRVGDRVELTLVANKQLQVLVWRPDRNRVYLAYVIQPL